MRPDELSFEIRLERRTTKGSSSGRIMRLVPVFILEMHNQMNYRMFAKVRPDKLSVLSIRSMSKAFIMFARRRLSRLCPHNSCLRIVELLFVISI